MSRPNQIPATRMASWMLAVLLLSCAPGSQPETTDSAADASPTQQAGQVGGKEQAPSPVGLAAAGVNPAAADTGTTSATAPGLSAATAGNIPPQRTAIASAPPGKASAYWARSGQNVDAKTPWRSVRRDGIHDRSAQGVELLQEPRRAFRGFPRANSGNYVDWAAALREGIIKPRKRVGRGGAMEHLDLNILMVDTKNMPYVIFPHRTHTEWLACRNCHDWLFEAKIGANDLSMAKIFKGRQCGLCHGRVAFPPSECFRCHSGPRPK